MDDKDSLLQEWQKLLLDQRLLAIEDHPELVQPILGLINVLESKTINL